MNDDLIRRSDVLDFLNLRIDALICENSDSAKEMAVLQGVREVVKGLPGMLLPEEQLKLFTKTWDDGRVEYRYGPEWVAMQLYMEGGYATPEEAKLRWLEYWEGHK